MCINEYVGGTNISCCVNNLINNTNIYLCIEIYK